MREPAKAQAITPDHVHVLIRKHRDKAEQMIAHLQENSRDDLIENAAYPANHPIWGGPGWKVFLETAEDIERTIRYIEKNPQPYGLPPQRHAFVAAYDGWDLSAAAVSCRTSLAGSSEITASRRVLFRASRHSREGGNPARARPLR